MSVHFHLVFCLTRVDEVVTIIAIAIAIVVIITVIIIIIIIAIAIVKVGMTRSKKAAWNGQ